MSKIKETCTIILSREAVRLFMQDELLPYGTFDGMEIVSCAATNSDSSNFLTLKLAPKPPKPKPEK